MHSAIFKLIVMSLALTTQGVTIAQAQAQSPGGLPEVALSRLDLGDFKIDTTEVSIGRFAEYAGRKGLVTAAERVGVADVWPRHAPVGQTRQGVNGLYDMGAHVWKWLADAQDGAIAVCTQKSSVAYTNLLCVAKTCYFG